MRIGVRAHDYGRHDAAGLADLLASKGFVTAQVAPAKCLEGINCFRDVRESDIEAVGNAFSSRGMHIAVFGCYVDLSSSDEEKRMEAVRNFCRALQLNKILGADVVGTETASEHFGRIGKAEHFPYMMDSLNRICDEAERLDTNFAIEPVDYYPLDDAAMTEEVIGRLGSTHVKVIFDLMNVMKEPQLYDQDTYWRKSFNTIGKYIAVVHLKDYVTDGNGKVINCPLGQGVLDYGVLKEWLAGRRDMPVLREGIDPLHEADDIKFMQDMKAETEN